MTFQDYSPLAQHLARLSATLKSEPMPTKKIRALMGDYFLNGQVAEKGRTYTVAADDAYILVAQKRAEYVK
jgi:hypothetical protein